jgi:hypothetical protein
MTPQAAATEYLRLAAIDESNGTHAAMAFAIDYESARCQSEDDFGIYLRPNRGGVGARVATGARHAGAYQGAAMVAKLPRAILPNEGVLQCPIFR